MKPLTTSLYVRYKRCRAICALTRAVRDRLSAGFRQERCGRV